MKGSRITAVGIILAAGAWIGSGYLGSGHEGESRAAVRPVESANQTLFRVAVEQARVVPHSRKLVLSGRTEADRKVMIVARANGILTDLRVRRGQHVKQGEIIAVLSDEAREAQVAQAQAVLAQRKAEFEARRKLIEQGTLPRLDLNNLESQYRGAEAALANAQAERERGILRAPWSGIITDVPAEVGGAAFAMAGKEIAQLVALDPMLAVVEVSERRLGGIKIGDTAEIRLVTGQTVTGRIRHVARTASQTTRTYRVEAEIANADGAIPDGISAEVAIKLSPTPATRVARSALTFSTSGELGVRTVNDASEVRFVPVAIAEDEQSFMWVTGIPDGARVIVQGQDFVREGQRVEVMATPAKTVDTATR
jgi:multidrug efflux system membrane fusion protein